MDEGVGNFIQTLEFFGQEMFPVDYNVIYIDEDAAIEYDCNPEGTLDETDYCVHIMSRTPTMEQEKLDQLLQFAGL